ncbi:MAG: hypothetical protein QXZ41_04685 [Ignisphaera sp.]
MMPLQEISPDLLTVMLLTLALLSLIILTALLYVRLRSGFMKRMAMNPDKYDEVPYKYISIIKCVSNDHTADREFQEGDFVGKVIGECPKCGNKLVIDAIYAQYIARKR